MQNGYLHNVVITNLRKIMMHFNIESNKQLSEFADVKEKTIESWFSNKRSPKISTLDKIANKLKIPTYILFKEDLEINDINIYDSIENNSSDSLEKNLRNVYIRRGKTSWNEISSIYSGLLSIDTLKSYHRKKNRITPPLNTLERLSSYLGIPAGELIKEDYNEKNQ